MALEMGNDGGVVHSKGIGQLTDSCSLVVGSNQSVDLIRRETALATMGRSKLWYRTGRMDW